jgi:hypothetical protein
MMARSFCCPPPGLRARRNRADGELEPEGLDAKQETRWSEDGSISDMLVFHW